MQLMQRATSTQKGKPLHIETSLVQKRKCVSSLYIHMYTMHGYVIDYYTSFYNVYISLHMQLGMHQSTCIQAYMHAHCVCAVCVYPAYDWMYAYLHLYVQIFLCSIAREWSPPTSVAQSQWTRENVLSGIQTKNTLSSLGKWRWQRAIS